MTITFPREKAMARPPFLVAAIHDLVCFARGLATWDIDANCAGCVRILISNIAVVAFATDAAAVRIP